jgi:creatine kinase
LTERHTSLLAAHLTPELYDMLKGRQTLLGATLNDLMRPGLDSPSLRAGVAACDEECYTLFAQLLDPIIAALQVR